jgi:hypothetical protein
MECIFFFKFEQSQPLVFLKLDFAQAYDKMNWELLFRTMLKMGVPKTLLRKEVKTRVYFNGAIIITFQIKKKVRQRCPLTPYLFIVVEEVFNFMIKEISKLGEIKGVTFIGGTIQQIIRQYDII